MDRNKIPQDPHLVRWGRHELGMTMPRLVGVETERSSENGSGSMELAPSAMAVDALWRVRAA
jgi:hypothetical protein